VTIIALFFLAGRSTDAVQRPGAIPGIAILACVLSYPYFERSRVNTARRPQIRKPKPQAKVLVLRSSFEIAADPRAEIRTVFKITRTWGRLGSGSGILTGRWSDLTGTSRKFTRKSVYEVPNHRIVSPVGSDRCSEDFQASLIALRVLGTFVVLTIATTDLDIGSWKLERRPANSHRRQTPPSDLECRSGFQAVAKLTGSLGLGFSDRTGLVLSLIAFCSASSVKGCAAKRVRSRSAHLPRISANDPGEAEALRSSEKQADMIH
jgi:hypothetical protein